MTDKKEKIIYAALELFSNEGYNATSTNKIAKAAGVSEGLIFRHFKNKNGLLDAIIEQSELKLREILVPILFETDSKKVIRKTIELPYSVKESEFDFWRLQFKLKWETKYHNPDKMKPLIDKLSAAFAQLKYKNPEQEAILLNHLMESISMEILRGNIKQQKKLKSFLIKKYNL